MLGINLSGDKIREYIVYTVNTVTHKYKLKSDIFFYRFVSFNNLLGPSVTKFEIPERL